MTSEHWWRDAVVYQVYVRSFADADGDGVGDLDGIREHLDHLVSLGVDAIWLNPCYPSPQADHGYDVADYFAIHSEYGDLDTFDRLLADAQGHGIRVLMDLVPNHCSSEHPWFLAARAAAPGSAERARFYFRDGRPTGEDPHGAPPNNWSSAFGGSAWARASDDDPQWYLATFTPEQPDFDHTNADVQSMFIDVVRFWFDRGVDGFRVDAVGPVGKHPDLPDAPPVPSDAGLLEVTWLNPYTVHRQEGHDVWRYLRSAIDEYVQRHPGRDLTMVAETYMNGRPDLMGAFVNDEQFHQAFAFDLLLSPWEKSEIERAIHDSLDIVRSGSTPTWTLNNHDAQRVVTRLGRRDAADRTPLRNSTLEAIGDDVDTDVGRRRARAMITLAMALPGALYLYMGEELGLPEVLDIPAEHREDPVFHRTAGERIGRDGCRVPFPWTDDPSTNFGFSPSRSVPGLDGDASRSVPGLDGDASVGAPWLPQPKWWGTLAVERLDGDEDSMLELYRRLVGARADFARPQGLDARLLQLGDGLVAVRRGDLVTVTNVTSVPIDVDLDAHLDAATAVVTSDPRVDRAARALPGDTTTWFVPG